MIRKGGGVRLVGGRRQRGADAETASQGDSAGADCILRAELGSG